MSSTKRKADWNAQSDATTSAPSPAATSSSAAPGSPATGLSWSLESLGSLSSAAIDVDVKKPSLPFLLRILTGMVWETTESQQLAREHGIVHMLHRIEGTRAHTILSFSKLTVGCAGISSITKVGPMAESLLAALQTGGNSSISSLLAQLRQETKAKVRALELVLIMYCS